MTICKMESIGKARIRGDAAVTQDCVRGIEWVIAHLALPCEANVLIFLTGRKQVRNGVERQAEFPQVHSFIASADVARQVRDP